MKEINLQNLRQWFLDEGIIKTELNAENFIYESKDGKSIYFAVVSYRAGSIRYKCVKDYPHFKDTFGKTFFEVFTIKTQNITDFEIDDSAVAYDGEINFCLDTNSYIGLPLLTLKNARLKIEGDIGEIHFESAELFNKHHYMFSTINKSDLLIVNLREEQTDLDMHNIDFSRLKLDSVFNEQQVAIVNIINYTLNQKNIELNCSGEILLNFDKSCSVLTIDTSIFFTGSFLPKSKFCYVRSELNKQDIELIILSVPDQIAFIPTSIQCLEDIIKERPIFSSIIIDKSILRNNEKLFEEIVYKIFKNGVKDSFYVIDSYLKPYDLKSFKNYNDYFDYEFEYKCSGK